MSKPKPKSKPADADAVLRIELVEHGELICWTVHDPGTGVRLLRGNTHGTLDEARAAVSAAVARLALGEDA